MGIREALLALARADSRAPDIAPPPEGREDSTGPTSGRWMGSLINSITGLGGVNDKGTAGRPNTYRDSLTDDELTALYRFNGYARRVVDQLVDDALRRGWYLEDDTDDPEPLKAEFKRLHARSAFAKAAKVGRLYGLGGLLIVTDDKAQGISEPLTPANVRRVHRLVPFDAREATIEEWETDITADGYGEPRTLSVVPAQSGKWLRPHASRCLLFPGAWVPPYDRPLTQSRYSDSVLDAAWDAVRDTTSINQAGATAAQDSRIRILKSPNLGAQSAADTRAAFLARLTLLAQSIGMLNWAVLGSGEEFDERVSTVSGWKDLGADARLQLAAVTGMPQTLLFGETPGGLNSDGESHRKLWAGVCASWQELLLRDRLERLCALLYACREVRGEPVPTEWALEFRPIEETSEEEDAATRKTRAETDALYVQAGILTPEHIARSRFGEAGYQTEILPLEDDDLSGPLDLEPPPAETPEPSAEEPLAEPEPEPAPAPKQDAEAEGFRSRRFAVPAGAKGNAGKVLAWRDEHKGRVQGMTATGWRRARQLAAEETVSGEDLVTINAWFARHRGNEKVAPEHEGEPWRDAGYVSWLGWGGDTMRTYAAARVAANREDAHDGVAYFMAPMPDTAAPHREAFLALARSVVPGLVVSDDPHVTCLYLGPVLPDAVVEASEVAAEALASFAPIQFSSPRLTAFSAGEDGVPVVVEYEGAWEARDANGGLLRALAHLVGAKQHRTYRAHMTLGYAPDITPEQRAALAETPIPDDLDGWTSARVELRYGGLLVTTYPLTGRQDAEAEGSEG